MSSLLIAPSHALNQLGQLHDLRTFSSYCDACSDLHGRSIEEFAS
jgi:hypothetical protein